MKNKKGFTLIELLAVVIIIGLLVMIAFPAVSKYLIDTKKDTYSLHEAELKSATANMMSQCVQGNVEDCVPDNGESRTVYLNELIAQKYSSPIKDPANTENYCSNSDTYVVVTNSTNNVVNLEYQVCLVCSQYKSPICETVKPNDTCDKETDPERPVCGTAVGSSTVWTNADRIVSIGCSDTGCGCTQGTFYKRFEENAKQGVITVVDKAGNYTDCVVDVYVDKEVPTCSLTVEGNLGENGWYGGTPPVVKLSYNSSDISGIATYGMGVSSKNYDLNKKTSYTVSPGITTIYGYVKDNAGNVGICSVPVQYDPVVPTGEITYGYQVYPKSDIATVDGRNIKLNHFISEYGNVLGANIYLKSNTSGMSVTIYRGSTEVAKRTISAGVTFMKFSFRGNYDGLTIDMGSSGNISLIERVELITDQTTAGHYTNKDVIVYASSKDSFSGKGYYSFDGSAWQTSNSYVYGANVVNSNAKIKDFAGNESDPIEFNITNIDKEVPSCYITTEFEPNGKNNWFISNFGLTVHPSDVGVSDVRDHNITTDSSPSYTTTLSSTQTQDTKLTTWHGYVRDHAGNVNRCKIDVKLDKVDPVCKIKVPEPNGENNWYISDVVVDYTDSDETSGVVFRGMNVTGTVDYNSVRQIHLNYETKTEKFYCYVEDESGRTNQDMEPYKLDKTNPTCVITPDRAIDGENGWYRGDVKLTFSTSSDISPIVGYDFINSSTFNYANKRTTHTISTSTKGVTYYGYTKEDSGRTSTCELFVKMDEDKPTCSFDIEGTKGDNSWYVTNIKYTLKPVDPISDIQNKGIVGSNSKDYNGKGTLTHTQDKTGIKYWGFVKDNAGNENYCDSGAELKKDATIPNSCTLTITSGTAGQRGWYISDVGIGISTTIGDNLSGVVGYDIVMDGNTPTYSHKHSTFNVNTNSTSTSGTNYKAYIKDYAGNVRTCTVNVKRDTQKPTCYFSKTGTLGLNGWYKSAVTFNLNVYDNTGSSISAMNQAGVSDSSYTYNTLTSFKQSSDTSTYKYVYGKVEDLAGNTNTCLSSVRIDSVKPSCSLGVTSGTSGSGSWYKSNVGLSFVNGSGTAITPADNSGGSGILRYNITSSSSATYSGGNKAITIYSNTSSSGRLYYGYVQDRAGNSNYCTKRIYKDSSSPSCSFSYNGTEGDNGWYTSSVDITATPRDYYSDVSTFDLTTSSSASYGYTYSSSRKSVTKTQSAETDGTYYYCYAKDKAGNTYSRTSKLIKVDKTAPTCSVESRWYTWWIISGNWGSSTSYDKGGSVQVRLSKSGDVAAYGMSLNDSSVTYNGVSELSFAHKSGQTYRGFVKDAAGNASTCSRTITHSVSGDTCTINASSSSKYGSWHKSTITITMSGDVDSSKPDKYEFTAVNQSGTETHNVKDKTSFTISGDGVYLVSGSYGGVECSATVKKDTAAPTSFTVSRDITATASSPADETVTVTVSAKDATSGVARITYGNYTRYVSGKDVTTKFYYSSEGNWTRDYVACDAANNCTSSKSATVYVDYCTEALVESNYSGWSSCSSSCGEGTRTRTNTWTGTSGATCRVTEEESCTGGSGCSKVGDICRLNSSSSLFGSSIGSISSNYGEFDSSIYHFYCDAGCYTKSGYDKLCANSSACGDYYGWSVLAMRAAEEAEGTSHCSNHKAFWCTCNDGYKLAPYTENGQSGYIYSAFYGG